jgi:hypothetical protein
MVVVVVVRGGGVMFLKIILPAFITELLISTVV